MKLSSEDVSLLSSLMWIGCSSEGIEANTRENLRHWFANCDGQYADDYRRIIGEIRRGCKMVLASGYWSGGRNNAFVSLDWATPPVNYLLFDAIMFACSAPGNKTAVSFSSVERLVEEQRLAVCYCASCNPGGEKPPAGSVSASRV